MAKAQKGDLIRIANALPDRVAYENGDIFEVTFIDDDGDANFIDKDGDHAYTTDSEYEIHRKAGGESVCAHCGKTGVHTCRGAEYHAEPPRDAVNSPNHYTQGRFEVIDVIEDAVVGADPFEAVCQANIIKYTLRYRHKNGVEDLKKARWYLDKLISVKEVSSNVK